MKWALAVLLAGVALAAAGVAYDLAFVNIPYQDPTPEMEARWRHDLQTASNIMAAGGVIAAVGVIAVLLVACNPFRRANRDTEDRP